MVEPSKVAAEMRGHDPVCQHRAVVWHALSALDLDDDCGAAATSPATRGLTADEVIALKAHALRQAVKGSLALINPRSGRVIDGADRAA